jgi:hypothetical protein
MCVRAMQLCTPVGTIHAARNSAWLHIFIFKQAFVNLHRILATASSTQHRTATWLCVHAYVHTQVVVVQHCDGYLPPRTQSEPTVVHESYCSSMTSSTYVYVVQHQHHVLFQYCL